MWIATGRGKSLGLFEEDLWPFNLVFKAQRETLLEKKNLIRITKIEIM